VGIGEHVLGVRPHPGRAAKNALPNLFEKHRWTILSSSTSKRRRQFDSRARSNHRL
jgi:hypothetical protein